MRIPRKLDSEALVPTASMADIAFLLIVFFMLTFKVVPDRTDAKIPESLVREEIEVVNEAVWVGINKELAGKNSINWTCKNCDNNPLVNQEVTLDDMAQLTKEVLMEKGKKQVFVLKSSGDVSYQYIDLVIDTLRTSKAQVVMLLTEQKTVGG